MTRDELLALRANPNVQTILNLIAETEGTAKNNYNTAFGGGLLKTLDDHPREKHKFKGGQTTAAGRYQFLAGTWDEQAKKLGLTDFGPVSQDLAAINRIAERGALDAVLKGDFKSAIGKLGKEWASLPSSPYNQPKKSQAFVDKTLAALTGKPLPEVPTVAAAKAPAKDVVSSLLSAARVAPSSAPAAAAPSTGLTVPSLSRSAPPAAAASAQSVPWQDAVLAAQNEPPAWWDQEQAQQLADDDMEAERQKALASFFNETPTPRIAIPPEIDTLINRYLSMT
jgi:muramidase (phage lysozyme)